MRTYLRPVALATDCPSEVLPGRLIFWWTWPDGVVTVPGVPGARPLGVPEPDTAPTLVQGIDSTPTTFSIDVLDAGDVLEAQWVTSPPLNGSTWSTVTQNPAIGNPAPSYAIAFDEIHNAIEQPFAFRNFGIAAASLIVVTAEFRFDGDTSCRQAMLHVANDVAGAGVLAYYQLGGELASGLLEIRKSSAWNTTISWLARRSS